jgi:predicted GIY-YIG superfamily endonuclease
LLKEILATIDEGKISQIKEVKPNKLPALTDIGYSIIYVLKTSNNFFYVGESDNFPYRVKAHRSRLNDDNCHFFYIAIKEGKSEARKIEQKLIIKLKNNNFPMLSISDGDNRNFGL